MQLFVNKIMKHFLVDENGPVDSLETRCRKPKVGSDSLLDDSDSLLDNTP